jgi:hypothetical protein
MKNREIAITAEREKSSNSLRFEFDNPMIEEEGSSRTVEEEGSDQLHINFGRPDMGEYMYTCIHLYLYM